MSNQNAETTAEKLIKLCRLYESIPADKQNQITGLISFIIDALRDPTVKSWLAQLRTVLESLQKNRNSRQPVYSEKTRSR
jgi:hypothetical protein